MYTQRIIGEGKRESEYWFKIKQIWLKVKYQDHYDKISKRNFFKNFLEYSQKCGETWDYKDKNGNIKIPDEKDYDHARKHSCFKKYQWDECFEQYEHDQMTNAEKKAMKAFKKTVPKRILKELEQIERLEAHTDKLLTEQEQFDVHHEKAIMQTGKVKNAKLNMVREELELNKQRLEFEGNLNQNVKVNRMELVKQKRKELNDLRRGNRSD